MTITAETLYDCLSEAYTTEVVLDEQEQMIMYLQHQNYRTSLTMQLFGFSVENNPETHYGVRLWCTFIDLDDNPLDFRQYSEAQINQLCQQLNDEIIWSRLRPQALDPAGVTVELFRALHIHDKNPDDLSQRLQQGINDVLCEWLTLFPLLQAVAEQTLEDFSNLGQFLNHGGKKQ